MLAFTHSSPVIRRAEREDAALIDNLYLSSLLCVQMQNAPVTAIGAFARMLAPTALGLDSAGGYYFAESAGEILGGLGWTPGGRLLGSDTLLDEDGEPFRLPLGEDGALVRGFFTVPGAAEDRIARLLMARAETDAARSGLAFAEAIGPARALEAYRRLGFRLERKLRLTSTAGDAIGLVHMRKRLAVMTSVAA